MNEENKEERVLSFYIRVVEIMMKLWIGFRYPWVMDGTCKKLFVIDCFRVVALK